MPGEMKNVIKGAQQLYLQELSPAHEHIRSNMPQGLSHVGIGDSLSLIH